VSANEINELVKQVRKHGRVKVATKAEAVEICRTACREYGWQFGQSQQFGGFVVEDMEA
jgi:hypothetical protein